MLMAPPTRRAAAGPAVRPHARRGRVRRGGADHTGNQFAANSGAGLRDLMARMGHDSEQAAMINQHEARGADKTITKAIDTHVEDEKRKLDEGGAAGVAG
jgi:hypothetical protein